MKSIEIDRSKRLKDDPGKGHNRWHPDVTPILEVDPGEEVSLETRDASDGQMNPTVTVSDFDGFAGKVGHPLTGPVYIKGAEPGDLLEIEYVDIIPQSYGWTRNRPGAGFLRDLFPDPFVAHWSMKEGWATSQDLPGVRIPNGSFMGTAGIAPSRAQLEAWTAREADLVRRGGIAFPPDAEDAVPEGAIAAEGLRTIPPRENCGNVDAKQLTKGSRLLIPVNVPGALYSAGDGHFAQGDSECCITAIEMAETVPPLFDVPPMRAVFAITKRASPTLGEPAAWSPAFHAFLARLLSRDVARRPTAAGERRLRQVEAARDAARRVVAVARSACVADHRGPRPFPAGDGGRRRAWRRPR